MKKTSQKRFLLIGFFVTFALCFSSLINNVNDRASAANETTKQKQVEEVVFKNENIEENFNMSTDDLNSMENAIINIKEFLMNNDSDVKSELYKQIEYYDALLNTAQDEIEYNKILNLKITAETHVSVYENIENTGVISQASTNAELIAKLAVSSVLAYFNSQGYTLAAELLSHMDSNNDLDSIYEPVNTSRIFESQVFTNIVNTSSHSGTGSFDSGATTAEMDLYYAIHAFSYTKSHSNRVIVINDRYDFENSDYPSTIGTIAVATMVTAQSYGIIVPYMINVNKTNSGSALNQISTISANNTSRCIERVATLGVSEYAEYNISFSFSGNVTMQTFGHKDAYLQLFNSSGTQLAYNDDAGYNLNALISYNFSANVSYKIRVKFWSSSQQGSIKLVVMPTAAIGAYEDISAITKNSTTWLTGKRTFAVTSEANRVKPLIYKPETDRLHDFTTDSSIDTYLYLIDPRSIYMCTASTKEIFKFPCAYNDDSGGNYQALITKYVCKNVPYLLITSTYNLTTTGKYTVVIKDGIFNG